MLVLRDTANDGGGVVVFPVKRITIMYKSKDKFERMYNPSISAVLAAITTYIISGMSRFQFTV